MQFFNTNEPYDIAYKVTAGHELTNDLLSHVYLIMNKKKGIKNLPAFFARVAYKQWNLPSSEFNLLHRPRWSVEINEDITSREESEWIKSEYKVFLRDYINQVPTGECNAEWFKRQIAKFKLIGMTNREIKQEYGISTWHVSETIKQFKKDVYDNYISSIRSEDSDNI